MRDRIILMSLAWLAASLGSAQAQQPLDVPSVISAAETKYDAAVEALKHGQVDEAQALFDEAVMEVFGSDVDLETNAELAGYMDSLQARIVERHDEARVNAPETGASLDNLFLDEPLDLLDDLLDLSPAEITGPGAIAAEINFPINTDDPLVTKMLNLYTKTGPGRATTKMALKNADQKRPGGLSYYQIAVQQFTKVGVPTDLVWLAFPESRWITTATSFIGCCHGLFQLKPSTAKDMGMSGTRAKLVNPAHNSLTAAKYLRWLHKQWGLDWARAVGSFNWGVGNMLKVSKKLGTTSFWKIAHSGKIPKETMQYTPQMIAAIHIAKNRAKYGF
jgi:membrane-bound lytic murein transglycosylase D